MPISHMSSCLVGFVVRELPITWNSITPFTSSFRALSSREAWAGKSDVCSKETSYCHLYDFLM